MSMNILDPSSEAGQRLIRNSAFEQPLTQGDPPPPSATGEEMIIKVPEVTWALGDPEQSTASGVTVTTRPIYYKGKRAGSIHRDYAEPLMTQLLALPPSSPVADSPTKGEFHWAGPLPKEAIVSACAFLEARFGKARCDNEAVSECVRCSTVAVARWLLTAIERVAALSAPSASAERTHD